MTDKQHVAERELVEAHHRAEIAETKLQHMIDLQRQQEQYVTSEIARREEAQKAVATADKHLEQLIANNTTLVQNNSTAIARLSANPSLQHIGQASLLVVQERLKSSAMKDIRSRAR